MTQRRRYRKDQGKRRLVVPHWITGVAGYIVKYTQLCSGCTDYGDYGTAYGPFGCDECGYTGKRRVEHWVPFDFGEADRAFREHEETHP